MVSLGTQPANRKSGFGHSSPTGARAQDLSRQPARPDLWGARVSNDPGLPDRPTTLAAILTSLRIGFQTLAIEQRAGQAWRILGAVRTEFDKFGGVLDKVKRQLNSASRTIEETGVRSRAMERKLRSVEQMPDGEAARILELPALSEEIETEETEAAADLEASGEDDGV